MAVKTSKNKRSEHIRDIIKQEGESLFDELGNKDPEFDPAIDLPPSGPEFFSQNAKHKDELVIDELLSSVPRNQGYYLKLYRNVGPNQYELKQRVDNYDTWTDLEWEITSIVRHNTKLNPAKWGSGTYRVVIWRDGGIRSGAKYRPMEFYIDAQEPEGLDAKSHTQQVDPMALIQEQMSGMAQMMQAVSAFMPKQIDPTILQQQQAEAFKQGLQASANESSSSNNAMAVMMTAVMGMMGKMMETVSNVQNAKPVSAVESSEQALSRTIETLSKLGLVHHPEKSKSIIEQLAEMKALGFDPFKQNDPTAQIQQVKSIVGLVGDLTGAGGGERPGILEKIIDALAPALPSLLPSIKGLSDNYMMLQQRQAPPAITHTPPVPQSKPQTSVYDEPMGSVSGGIEPPKVEDPMIGFLKKLRHSIIIHDQAFFPNLFNVINQYGGQQAVNGILSGMVTPNMLVQQVQQWGGDSFKTPDMQAPSLAYAQAFIAWLQGFVKQQQAAQQPQVNGNGHGKVNGVPLPDVKASEEVVARCLRCQAEYVYDNEDQFRADQGTCEDIMSGTICGGELALKG